MDNFDFKRMISTYSDNVNKEIAFDLQYNVSTKTPTKISKAGILIMDYDDNSSKYPMSTGYQSCPEEYLDLAQEQLENILGDTLGDFDFVDIGSGYGKVIFYLLTKDKKFKSYSGIEIDTEYHSVAESNKSAFSLSVDLPVSFYNNDGLEYEFKFNNSILFLSNPLRPHYL